jgi:glyoxylase-like metal-dependent hydrolase (beta-lactamase superfamily II)
MLRERVSNNIYIFTSELYAQVTAGAILTPDGAIVIDTLPYPSETREIVKFVEGRHATPVRFVVNTHYHADHSYGSCFFQNAEVVAHTLCRDLLDTRGREALSATKASSSQMRGVEVVLPDIVFDKGTLNLHLGGTTVNMLHSPGHSPDSIVCMVEEERILFAADTLMPLPFFTDGSIDDFEASLKNLLDLGFESVVQGHGEVILRGEIKERIKDDLKYLKNVRREVKKAVKRNKPPEFLETIDIEECGKSRIPLNGLVQDLHASNVETLYYQLMAEAGREVAPTT